MKLKSGSVFYAYEGSSKAPEFLLRTPSGRQFRISPLAKEILESLDGKTNLEQVAQRLQSRNISITVDQLERFLEKEYGPLEIFEDFVPASNSSQQVRKSRIPVFLHGALLPAGRVFKTTRAFTWLFNRFVVIAGILAIIGAHYWIYRSELPALIDDEVEVNLLVVNLLALLSILFHEFGHAAAVTRFGGSPGSIGFGLYALIPAFYTDVSEAWRLSRRQRMIVDSAGVYFQQLVFFLFAILSRVTGVAEFAVACTLLDAMTLLTLNPVFQFDGYWFLVDYLGLPNLQQLAWTKIKSWFRRTGNDAALPTLSHFSHLIFWTYVIGSVVFLAWLLRLEYHQVLRPAIGFFRSLPKIGHLLAGAFQAREFLRLGNYFFLIFYAAIIPVSAVFGCSTYAVRIYRYFSRRRGTIAETAA